MSNTYCYITFKKVVTDILNTVRLFRPKIQKGMAAPHLFAGETGTSENVLWTARLKDLIAALR
jgi:hypothetical protein